MGAQNLGGFAGWFMTFWPLVVMVITFLMTWCLINFLMWWPEGRFHRQKYLNFMLGDSPIGLPLMFGGAAGALMTYQGSHKWWGQSWWEPVMWIISAIITVGFFLGERAAGQYTPAEQRTPSKVAHYLIVMVGLAIGFTIVFPAFSTIEASMVWYGWGVREVWRSLETIQLQLGFYDLCMLVGLGVWGGAFIHDTFFGEFLEGAHMDRRLWREHLARKNRARATA